MRLSELGEWSLELVTAEVAEKWLENRAPNRSVMVGRVKEYGRSMIAGDWKVTHQGIAFDMTGKLIDGQHRLKAIVEENFPQWMMVFRWKVSTDMIAIDDGKARTIRDAATIAGTPMGTTPPAVVRIINGINAGGYRGERGRLTRQQSLRMIEDHRTAIDWADEKLGHDKGTGAAVVKAVVAMAWYSCDRRRLEEFCNVLRTGVCEDRNDSAAMRVRDFVKSNGSVGGGSNQRLSAFRKIQGGLQAFLDRRPLSKLYERDGILFPIPNQLGNDG